MAHWRKSRVAQAWLSSIQIWEWRATEFLAYEVVHDRVRKDYACSCFMDLPAYVIARVTTLKKAKQVCEKHFRDLAAEIEYVRCTTKWV